MSKSRNLAAFQQAMLQMMTETNEKLDKICALLVSNQLLQECVSPEGKVRTAEECADIVNESYCAGMCLSDELTDHRKKFDYQKSEFFLDEDEDELQEDSDEEDEDSDDNEPPTTTHFSMKF